MNNSDQPVVFLHADQPDKPAEPPTFTCDWGHCNEKSVDSRWAPDLREWLGVCAHHVTGRPNTRWRRS